jgi:hypothetical protein
MRLFFALITITALGLFSSEVYADCLPSLGMTEAQLIAACGQPPTPARFSAGITIYIYPGIQVILQLRNGQMTVTNMQLMAGQ